VNAKLRDDLDRAHSRAVRTLEDSVCFVCGDAAHPTCGMAKRKEKRDEPKCPCCGRRYSEIDWYWKKYVKNEKRGNP